jgi:hypothetical protein
MNFETFLANQHYFQQAIAMNENEFEKIIQTVQFQFHGGHCLVVR